MGIDLSKFLDKGENAYHFKGEVESGPSEVGNEEFQITCPVAYNGSIYKVDGFYNININILYKYESRCARCLKKAIKKVSTSIDGQLEEYNKAYASNDTDNMIFYDEDILDIDEYVLMEVSSSLPMKTLCTDDCKGVCSQCGTDLNEGSCSCLEDNIDPRFEKLKDFFD